MVINLGNMALSHKAQGFSEYAILIGTIAAAAIMVQVYLKRGIQSAIKTTADDLGNCANRYYGYTAQTMGAMEPGLVMYKINTPINTVAHQTSELTEFSVPRAFEREVNASSNSQTSAGWTISQTLKSEDEFVGVERTKKPR